MIYHCCKPERRDVLAQQSPPALNGIDYVEVMDNPGDPDDVRQCRLLVYFIHDLLPGQLGPQNVRISGGERIPSREISLVEVVEEGYVSPPGDPKVLLVQVAKPGDFSTYTLSLVDDADPSRSPLNLDPVLSTVQFSFKVACPSDFDCQARNFCAPPAAQAIDISYLAKDYASFRQLMFDRIATIMPQWQERNAADLGTMLVEMVSYVGDYLSYQQDAVATEAYLQTARRRSSVHRHARLVGYPMHDGRNARTWVHFEVRGDIQGLTLSSGAGNKLLTRVNCPRVLVNPSNDLQDAIDQGARIFELMCPVTLFSEHNQISFYTWGNQQCCLPRGATQAWLRGHFPNLKVNDVLVFEEAKGPETGVPEDADPLHRWAVRLTKISFTTDPIGGLLDPVPNNNPVEVTAIEWMAEDALPFPVCISTKPDKDNYFDDVSIVLGNIALADDGNTIAQAEDLPPVPDPNPYLTVVAPSGGDHCKQKSLKPAPARYRPLLKNSPVTFAEPFACDGDKLPSASAVLGGRAVGELLPAITLTVSGEPGSWKPQRDLLRSHDDAREFVVEAENDGSAYLRFGDGKFGNRPAEETVFHATYRVGNGAAGNIGANSLYHFASSDPSITADPSVILDFTNPLPAVGGVEPESIEQVRQRAPQQFRTQNRAVTPQDYGDRALECDPTLQKAVGTFRWTGSWQTVFIAVDRQGGAEVNEEFSEGLAGCMERYRMAGHDVEVDRPEYVSLEIEMNVCVKADFFASDVELAVLEVLSNHALPDGTLGIFHPDNFTFGQTVYLSPLYARVQSLDGVDSVKVAKFQRQGKDSDAALNAGKLELARLEIARLENDPSFPERGSLKLKMLGGR